MSSRPVTFGQTGSHTGHIADKQEGTSLDGVKGIASAKFQIGGQRTTTQILIPVHVARPTLQYCRNYAGRLSPAYTYESRVNGTSPGKASIQQDRPLSSTSRSEDDKHQQPQGIITR